MTDHFIQSFRQAQFYQCSSITPIKLSVFLFQFPFKHPRSPCWCRAAALITMWQSDAVFELFLDVLPRFSSLVFRGAIRKGLQQRSRVQISPNREQCWMGLGSQHWLCVLHVLTWLLRASLINTIISHHSSSFLWLWRICLMVPILDLMVISVEFILESAFGAGPIVSWDECYFRKWSPSR